MQHIFDMIIIGGGPAGYSAALYASRAGMDCVVLEKMSPGGQMALTDVIDNYPGFEAGVDGFDLGMKMQTQAERFGAKTEYAEVTDVDFTEKIKKVRTTAGEYLSKTVVIATGANARELGLENEKEFVGRGVHYCAHCDGRFYKDKIVAVVGGGNSAVQDALYLSRLAKKVYLIHRRDTFRATKIYLSQLEKTKNVEILFNSTVAEILTDERVSGVKIKDVNTEKTENIVCDGVFVSIGRKPVTEFLKGSVKLDNGGYVLADETTKTDVAGVFAAGDVRTKALRQVVTAVADGATAVHFAEEF
ncbi:MAG: thioredoxin-disulfide reductase [Clostridia bacterium]|nr:thioredoxin-disulfide reductase [Clostridia bacterium]